MNHTSPFKLITLRIFQIGTAAYALGALAWAITHPFLGDWGWRTFIVNAFSVYLFLPAPVFLLMALALRQRLLPIALAFVMVAGLYWHGWMLLPKFPSAPANAPRLSVMTFNVLFVNHDPTKTIRAIQEANADVVSLQELNFSIARGLRTQLAKEYPYQLLDPADDASGMGLISRYPFTVLDAQSFDFTVWDRKPQFVSLNLGGKLITVINAHPAATVPGDPYWMRVSMQSRMAQMQSVVDFVKTRAEPVIVPIDMNATPQNDPYRLMSSVLIDSWHEAGWGFGHTFPGAATPGGSRPTRRGVPIVPQWLLRIDYVWHSHQLVAAEVKPGPFDEQSDHRPMLATLALVK